MKITKAIGSLSLFHRKRTAPRVATLGVSILSLWTNICFGLSILGICKSIKSFFSNISGIFRYSKSAAFSCQNPFGLSKGFFNTLSSSNNIETLSAASFWSSWFSKSKHLIMASYHFKFWFISLIT